MAKMFSPNVDALMERVKKLQELTNETCHNAQELALVNSERTRYLSLHSTTKLKNE